MVIYVKRFSKIVHYINCLFCHVRLYRVYGVYCLYNIDKRHMFYPSFIQNPTPLISNLSAMSQQLIFTVHYKRSLRHITLLFPAFYNICICIRILFKHHLANCHSIYIKGNSIKDTSLGLSLYIRNESICSPFYLQSHI